VKERINSKFFRFLDDSRFMMKLHRTAHSAPSLQDPYASLGQRRGLSDKDVSKLNEMYEQDCSEDYILNFDRFGNYIDELLDYFQGNIQDLLG